MTPETGACFTFFSDEFSARVHCGLEGPCLLQITREAPDSEECVLRILHQPCDERGLACGFASLFHEQRFSFSTALGGKPQAFCWLPARIDCQTADDCYYQILPIDSPT